VESSRRWTGWEGVLVFRNTVNICDASPSDAAALVEVWSSLIGRAPESEAVPQATQEAASAVARIAADPDQKLLVARVEDQVAGAVHLSRSQLSPVHSDTAVYVMHLQVIESFRRHGVGRALMEATVTWAEEKDTDHVIAAATVGSRDANRFWPVWDSPSSPSYAVSPCPRSGPSFPSSRPWPHGWAAATTATSGTCWPSAARCAAPSGVRPSSRPGGGAAY